MNCSLQTCVLFIQLDDDTIEPGPQKLDIPENIRPELQSYLEKIYGKDAVYLPGYIIPVQNLKKSESDLNMLADLYFNGTHAEIAKYREQHSMKNICGGFTFGIPYIINLNTAQKGHDLNEYKPWNYPEIKFTKKGMESMELDIVPIGETEIMSDLRKSMGIDNPEKFHFSNAVWCIENLEIGLLAFENEVRMQAQE